MYNADANKIMLVDDDESSRALYNLLLTKAGYAVIEAQSGEEALQVAEKEQFNAILLDIHMPGIDGIATCRKLREIAQHKTTPILFLTADDKTSVLKEAFEAGGDDFIQKPIDSVILKARLKSHMQRASYYREIDELRSNLNRYISTHTQKMVERYTKTGILPPPEYQNLCIMFTDIRDYTALSQKADAKEIFSTLSQQLGEQVDLVYQHGGYVDKFGGDGIMAVFEGEDKSQRACLCALDIIDKTQQHFSKTQKVPLIPGIGINIGEAVLGNIGSDKHLDYSVIGNTVNLAARLCGESKPMSITITKAVRDDISNSDNFAFTNEDKVKIKGITEPVDILNLSRSFKK